MYTIKLKSFSTKVKYSSEEEVYIGKFISDSPWAKTPDVSSGSFLQQKKRFHIFIL
jgi:hypothetical protein